MVLHGFPLNIEMRGAGERQLKEMTEMEIIQVNTDDSEPKPTF